MHFVFYTIIIMHIICIITFKCLYYRHIVVSVPVPKHPLQFISLFSCPQSSGSQNCRLTEHSYVTVHCAEKHEMFISLFHHSMCKQIY